MPVAVPPDAAGLQETETPPPFRKGRQDHLRVTGSDEQAVADLVRAQLLIQNTEVEDITVEMIVGPADLAGGAAPAIGSDHQVFLVAEPVGPEVLVAGNFNAVDEQEDAVIAEGKSEIMLGSGLDNIMGFQPDFGRFGLEPDLDIAPFRDPGRQMPACSVAAGIL